jgi:hypothetical protein
LVATQAILEHCWRNTACFLARLWQWMKHGYICIIQRQKNNLRSGDTVIHLVQKSCEYRSQPPRWWNLFSGTKKGYCSLNASKRAQQSKQAATYLSWIKWSRHWSL